MQRKQTKLGWALETYRAEDGARVLAAYADRLESGRWHLRAFYPSNFDLTFEKECATLEECEIETEIARAFPFTIEWRNSDGQTREQYATQNIAGYNSLGAQNLRRVTFYGRRID